MKYGVIGKTLKHSYSPQIHKLFGNSEYGLIELDENALGEFFRKREFAGVNVTVPYKQTVMQYLDSIDPAAQAIGCVNTVVNRNGYLTGYNTDIDGLTALIAHAGLEVCGKNALVLGSGGTSKTAVAALTRLKAANIAVISRSGDDNYENIYSKHSDAEIIINTTPLGMYPNTDTFAVEPSGFHKLEGLIDVVYNPHRTELVLRSLESGIRSEGGLYMLVSQARKAHELFFDCELPEDAVDRTVKTLENEMQNIVLIGMPGSGKSTVGKLIADKLSRSFYDTDAEIEKQEGISISEIFAQHGEQYFRDLETRTVKELSKLSGAVIACGGGTPMRPENRRAVSRNSRTVYLKRDISELETVGRPLSSSQNALKEIFIKREPVYKAMCNYAVNVSDDPDVTAERVMSAINEEKDSDK